MDKIKDDPFTIEKTVWAIMSRDRKVIATGRTRSRRLTLVKDLGNKKILTYKGKGMAEAAFKYNWFGNRTGEDIGRDDLEAVELRFSLTEK